MLKILKLYFFSILYRLFPILENYEFFPSLEILLQDKIFNNICSPLTKACFVRFDYNHEGKKYVNTPIIPEKVFQKFLNPSMYIIFKKYNFNSKTINFRTYEQGLFLRYTKLNKYRFTYDHLKRILIYLTIHGYPTEQFDWGIKIEKSDLRKYKLEEILKNIKTDD